MKGVDIVRQLMSFQCHNARGGRDDGGGGGGRRRGEEGGGRERQRRPAEVSEAEEFRGSPPESRLQTHCVLLLPLSLPLLLLSPRF